MAQKTSELAEKLDEELEEFISGLKPRTTHEAWPEDHWEEEMEKHPLFMSKPVEDGQDLPPLVEAMQKLKYDPDYNSPEELAMSYKEEGNQYFKLKKYKYSITSYTAALDTNCKDHELNSFLFANRAAAHFRLGNFKKALDDSLEAIKLKSNHVKAINRAAQCSLKLRNFEQCISLCKKGLEIETAESELQKSFKALMKDAEMGQKMIEKDKRKALVKANQEAKEWEKLMKVIKERGITFYTDSKKSGIPDWWPDDQRSIKSKVYINDEGCLVWPVLFLYPEYSVSDFIQHFHENASFKDHLEEMFCPGNEPSWDREHKYKIENLNLYYGHENNLISVDIDEKLRNILSAKTFIVYEGVPVFFITVNNSNYDRYWKSKGLKEK